MGTLGSKYTHMDTWTLSVCDQDFSLFGPHRLYHGMYDQRASASSWPARHPYGGHAARQTCQQAGEKHCQQQRQVLFALSKLVIAGKRHVVFGMEPRPIIKGVGSQSLWFRLYWSSGLLVQHCLNIAVTPSAQP